MARLTRFSLLFLVASAGFAQLGPINGAVSGGGTITSISSGCGLTGGPVTTTGTISQVVSTASHNGVYAILTGDCGKSLTTNTAAAWTIAQAGTTGFEAGKFWVANNIGSGSLTITATTSTFYGGPAPNISSSILTVPANSRATITSDGANYQVIDSGGIISSGQLNPNTVQFSSTSLTLSQILTLHSVPVQLIPAQGAGTYIEITGCLVNLTFGSLAFSGGGAVSIGWGAGPAIVATSQIAATFFTTFASSHSTYLVTNFLGAVATTTYANQAIFIVAATADFTGGTGASMLVDCGYRVHTGIQ